MISIVSINISGENKHGGLYTNFIIYNGNYFSVYAVNYFQVFIIWISQYYAISQYFRGMITALGYDAIII